MKPLLAATVTDLNKLHFPLFASPKIDGIRCLIQNERPVSRTLKPIPNEYIQMMLGMNHNLEGLDGELTVGDTFQSSTSGIMSRDGCPDFTYHIFDLVIPGGYSVHRWSKLMHIEHPFIKVLPQIYVKSAYEASILLEDYLGHGHEGMMLRAPDAPYKYGRSTLKEQILLKVKPFDFDEAEVIGFEERMHNANEATIDNLGHTERSSHQANLLPMNTLGSLIVTAHPWGEFRVGTGFDDETRSRIWNDQAFYLGSRIRFRYQTIGMKDKPRIPSFKGFIV